MNAVVPGIGLQDAELATAERHTAFVRDGGIGPIVHAVAAETNRVLGMSIAFEILLRDDVG